VDGVLLLKSHSPNSGIPVLRFFHPRLSLTLRALVKADAEVYYARGTGYYAGEAYEVARWRRAAFVLGTAHDEDVDHDFPRLRKLRDRWWASRTVIGADAIIAQSDFQRGLYRSEFGRESEVVPNLVEIPATAVDSGQPGAVVWLGTYKASKRPQWFTDLAHRFPKQRFVMCGLPGNPLDSWEAAQAAARECSNLEVRGFVDHNKLAELLSQAALFVHTSPAEGFPNTLLEAWAYGLPGIASVDPDGVIRREGLGEVVGSLDELECAVRRWLADPALRRAAGQRARAYVSERHAPDGVLERYASFLDRIVDRVRERRKRGARA
jgi:glycosyltransferase involved in cell wall biosynthesis